MKKILYMLMALIGSANLPAHAGSDYLSEYAREFNVAQSLSDEFGYEARRLNPKSTLSADAGRAFYIKKVAVKGKDLSCSSCHTDNPKNTGKHIETGKPIKPLAISANPAAFSDVKKVETNFAKHCRDLYGRDCSAQEKGDYLTYLLSVK